MEWRDLLELAVIVFPAVIFIIGMLIALRRRKKDSPQKVEDLLNHLQEIGIKSAMTEKSMVGEVESIVHEREGGGGSWLSRGWKEMWGWISGTKGRVEGIIKIRERHIDYVIVSSLAGQGGVNYFLDYLVRSSSWSGQNRRKDTIMVRKKRPSIRGKVVDIGWQGDDYLSQKLNFDQRLKDILLQVDLINLGYIEISPNPQYARVRTAYVLPSPDLLKAIDIIARHILS